ncbi:hypothetical protein ACSBR1_011033 [Camellia fascicularis]
MADMEIGLPEKKNPGLTPMDWVIFLGSAIVGLVTVVGSLDMPKADLWVIFAILSTVIGYCAKTYFMFQQNVAKYQNLITQSMYDKQLDSGKGTLFHLCDDVIQQEDTQSIGALGGLAIAILFTWGLLRSPSGAQRRQPKRQATTPSSSGVVSTHSNANLTFSRDLSSEDSRAQNVIDEFFQPVKPTLGQIVRQKLSEGRKAWN